MDTQKHYYFYIYTLTLTHLNINGFRQLAFEPQHVISTQCSSLIRLSLETPNNVRSVAFNSHSIFKRLAKALIRLRVCAGWSEPLLVAHTTLLKISSFCHYAVKQQNNTAQTAFPDKTCEFSATKSCLIVACHLFC